MRCTLSVVQTCVTAGCTRPAGDKYQGLCTNCYVKAATSPSDVIGRRVAVTTEAPSCIMDFCSNVGLTDCKGLCQQCFSALCQTRLQGTFDPPPPTATSATNCMYSHVRTGRLTVRRCSSISAILTKYEYSQFHTI